MHTESADIFFMQLADFFGSASSGTGALTSACDTRAWDEIIRDASFELLLPALGQRLEALGIASSVPPEIRNLLAATQDLNGERNRFFLNEAVHAANLLNSIGIQPVALKGLAYLIAGIYPNPACRYLLDIDLLIPESTLSRATALLHHHGFVDDDKDVIAPLRHHGPAMSRPGAPPIELHHRIALGVCDRLLPASEVLAAATPVRFEGAQFLIPSYTHLANHLILHSQLHNAYRYRVFPPLRALYDLLLLNETRLVDWDALVHRYREQNEYFTLALHFKEAQRLIGLQPPLSLPLGLLGTLRWARRRTIARAPWLRFVDPIHIVMSTFRNRLRMIPRLLEHPEHSILFAKAFTEKKFYRDLLGF